MTHPRYEAPNCSCWPLELEESPTVVCTTCLALRDTKSVRHMMSPDTKSQKVLALVIELSPPISMLPGSPPSAVQSLKLSSAASGTPTKFTRSFPANAKASAKVPASTMSLNTLRPMSTIAWPMAVKAMKKPQLMAPKCALIHSMASGLTIEEVLAPLTMRK